MKKVKQSHGGAIVHADKGETANPNGRPRKLVSDVINELDAMGVKAVTKTEINDCYLRLINLSIPELTDKTKDSKQPALVRIVGKAILSGKGFEVLEKMIDRSVGKAVQQIDISGEITTKDIIAKAFPDPINSEDESQPEPTASDQ